MLNRRLLMAQAGKMHPDVPFPWANGRHDFEDGSYVEVTNGNHAKVHHKQQEGQWFVNFSDIRQNQAVITDKAGNIGNKPAIFTFGAGSEVETLVSNLKIQGKASSSLMNFRIAESQSSANNVIGLRYLEGTIPQISKKTQYRSDTPIGCWFVYSNGTGEITMEFDFELYVNGERWT